MNIYDILLLLIILNGRQIEGQFLCTPFAVIFNPFEVKWAEMQLNDHLFAYFSPKYYKKYEINIIMQC